MLPLEELIRRLETYYRAQPPVAAAYLFGSQARGTARPGSDVDVAVLFRPSVPPLDRLDARVDQMRELEDLLGARVDVLDLREVSPVLIHQVLRDGVLVYEADPSERLHFEVGARRRYFDQQYRHQRHLQAVLKALKGEQTGGGTRSSPRAAEAARRILARLEGREQR